MPKIYRCDKINELGITCGETDNTKFEKGRYSTCKNCRLRFMSEYNKSKREHKQEDIISKVDPDNNIRWVIEDTIKRVRFCGDYTILEKFKDNDELLGEALSTNYKRNENTELKVYELENMFSMMFKELKKENELLKIEINTLKEKLSDGLKSESLKEKLPDNLFRII